MHSHRRGGATSAAGLGVLILVVMEDALALINADLSA